ncbi:hypothetical protein M3Y99_00480300 [Aphelenchoides fujianensis]|nr:hypothetical protein M3Y99_00480300 [Aphelenchoides fujianensis]
MQMSFAERTWREEAIVNRGRAHEIDERKGPSEKKAPVPSTGSSLHTFNDHERKFLSDARMKKLKNGLLKRFCAAELRLNAADEEAIREAHDRDLDNISVSSTEF